MILYTTKRLHKVKYYVAIDSLQNPTGLKRSHLSSYFIFIVFCHLLPF